MFQQKILIPCPTILNLYFFVGTCGWKNVSGLVMVAGSSLCAHKCPCVCVRSKVFEHLFKDSQNIWFV